MVKNYKNYEGGGYEDGNYEKNDFHNFPKEEDYAGDRAIGVTPPIASPYPSSELSIIEGLSPFKVLCRIRANLKGKFWDDETKEYVQIPGFVPLMNDHGINKYLSILSSFLNDTVTLSNIPPDEVNKLVLHIYDEVIPVMYVCYRDWGIPTKADLAILATQIFMMSYGSLHKASGAGDRAVIRGTISENIMQRGMYNDGGGVPPTMEPRRGFLSRINPFR